MGIIDGSQIGRELVGRSQGGEGDSGGDGVAHCCWIYIVWRRRVANGLSFFSFFTGLKV